MKRLESNDEETWDLDHYSALEDKLEKALALLKDEVELTKKEEYGEPIILEEGLLTLLDDWKQRKENEDDE